ncbi:MAG: transglycosylase domain-containing protein [Myxococcota bacterium]
MTAARLRAVVSGASRKRRPARGRSKARGGLGRRILRGLLLATIIGAVLGAVGLRATLVWLEGQLPDVLTVEDYRRNALQTTRVHAADGTVVHEWWRERRTVVPGDRIPRHVKVAAVAAEDGDFYEHEGLDWPGMVRALLVNLRDGRYSQGASTITQQVARTFYLSQDKTLRRKALELVLARKLEKHLSKDEILELYLNQIYFGHGRWGIAEAARHYLGERVAALSPADAATLMALVPAPEHLNPADAPEACRKRRDRILRDMVARGFLSEEDGRRAMAQPIRTVAPEPEPAGAPWFVDVVRRRLEEAVGREAVQAGGLRVYTTLDPSAQRAMDAAVRRRLGTSEASPEVAMVMMEPDTREVLALVGGTDWRRSPFNRAVQASRQPGSTFKPFVYGAGLERGVLTDETRYPNEITCYRGAHGRWCPHNAGGGHDGEEVSVAEALSRSLNVVAVRAMRDTGVAAVTDFARRVGIRSPIPADLTAALGSADVRPLELVNAYATFAAGGRAGRPVFVRRVEAPDGRVVFSETPSWRRGFSEKLARRMTTMLRRVVEEGTGRSAALDGVPIAGKTGTTDRRVDAWFVGYTVPDEEHPDLPSAVCGVWVGHDAREPLAGGSGGATAAPLFADTLSTWLGLDRGDAAAVAPR